jgi:hypothetical protein
MGRGKLLAPYLVSCDSFGPVHSASLLCSSTSAPYVHSYVPKQLLLQGHKNEDIFKKMLQQWNSVEGLQSHVRSHLWNLCQEERLTEVARSYLEQTWALEGTMLALARLSQEIASNEPQAATNGAGTF